MPLTENEKAATFIGWMPGVPCKNANLGADGCVDAHWEELPAGQPNSDDYRFQTKHWHHSANHQQEAPDMSDPRNYMKALEGLVTRNLSMCIGYRWVIVHDRHGLNLAEADTNGNIGLAAMKALAALYDAEHPEPDHGSV